MWTVRAGCNLLPGGQFKSVVLLEWPLETESVIVIRAGLGNRARGRSRYVRLQTVDNVLAAEPYRKKMEKCVKIRESLASRSHIWCFRYYFATFPYHFIYFIVWSRKKIHKNTHTYL